MSDEQPSSIRVLLIEDDAGDADLLKELLSGAKNFSFQVDWADRLSTGIEKLSQGKTDVLLLDLSLPDSKGLGTTYQVHARFPALPIVVLTGLDDDKMAMEVVRNGAQDYLVKGKVDGNMLSRVMRYAIERKRSEESLRQAYNDLQTAQTELIQAEKMSALGRFSTGIAHEVKNPLGIILGGVEFLERKLDSEDADTKLALSKVKESTLRADRILEGLLQFARPSKLFAEKVSARELVEDAIEFVRYKIKQHRVEISFKPPSDEMVLYVEKNQIQQVLLNLLLNAVEAMPLGGELTVELAASQESTTRVKAPVCIIRVIDMGVGISPEDMKHLFEPFFTTKRDGRGVGLGLSTSKMIMENHGGELLVESQLGQGTTVSLVLPLTPTKT